MLTPAQLEAGLQVPESAHLPGANVRADDRADAGDTDLDPTWAAQLPRLDADLSDASTAASAQAATHVSFPGQQHHKVESRVLGCYDASAGDESPREPSLESTECQSDDTTDGKLEGEHADRAGDHTADKERLQKLAEEFPLPLPQHGDAYNQLRYHIFSVYRRLFVVHLTINLILIITFAVLSAKNGEPQRFTYGDALTAVAANIILAMLMRQEHCINAMFYGVLSLPQSWSIHIRRHAAKIYCHGGVHSSAGVSAVLWYIFFAVLVQNWSAEKNAYKYAVLATTAFILLLFVVLTIGSLPWMRRHYHNAWELSHRYAGWTAVVIIWIQLLCISASNAQLDSQPLATMLVKTPAFWILIVTTLLLVYPWLYLRKVYFVAEKLSSHAVQLRFKDNKSRPACTGIALATLPMVENHKFATIPEANNQPGFSVIVSNAGDWTNKLVNEPPEYLWTRGTPALGVAGIAKVFRKVVLVATGSGIGPLMSFFNVYPEFQMRIVWSARSPVETFGNSTMEAVLAADKDAIIIDTKKSSFREVGMPDLVDVAFAAYQEYGAEAVLVISNPDVTHKVVYNLEKRKVPAYGAIWDS